MSSPIEKYPVDSTNVSALSTHTHFYQYPIPSVTSAANGGQRTTTEQQTVQKQESNSDSSQLMNEGDEKGKRKESLLTGSGPGGVPKRYFNVRKCATVKFSKE